MQLSIIIVNYNVKYFLEHCIISVQAACKNISAEIIVIDNASADDSVAMLQSKYTNVITIANKKNIGFAKANNQGVAIAKGDNILFLNPDTIVPEDCFEKCIAYLQANANIGALGVRLIDGKGEFLPESKRGFPSFGTAFFKISGLSSVFKKSTVFNKYHLGYLPEHQTNEVDVLVGCFMMMPKKVVAQVGSFSEDYFMYGEDIDLSYCVQKAGYKNVYFADTTVIHYKGESTKKGSLNYVKMFYNAMIIFARKHLAANRQSTFIPLIKLAIAARAVLSVANRFLNALWLPIIDGIIMLACLWQIKDYWMHLVKPGTNYEANTIVVFFTVYIAVWLSSIFIHGGYDKPLKKLNIIKGMFVGMILTLAIYGLLPETIRFSRGITFFGAASSAVLIWLSRVILQNAGISAVQSEDRKSNNIITVGSDAQVSEVSMLLKNAGVDKDIIGNVNTNSLSTHTYDLGSIAQLGAIAKTYQACEIIFTYNALSFSEIIQRIQQLGNQYNFKIHCQGTDSIIGSNSKNSAGDLYAADWHFYISTAAGRRSKRTFDIISAILIIVLSPILVWIWKPKKILQNALQVLFAQKTWVGYCANADIIKLPAIKECVVPLNDANLNTNINTQMLNMQYARTYQSVLDRKILWQFLWQ